MHGGPNALTGASRAVAGRLPCRPGGAPEAAAHQHERVFGESGSHLALGPKGVARRHEIVTLVEDLDAFRIAAPGGIIRLVSRI